MCYIRAFSKDTKIDSTTCTSRHTRAPVLQSHSPHTQNCWNQSTWSLAVKSPSAYYYFASYLPRVLLNIISRLSRLKSKMHGRRKHERWRGWPNHKIVTFLRRRFTYGWRWIWHACFSHWVILAPKRQNDFTSVDTATVTSSRRETLSPSISMYRDRWEKQSKWLWSWTKTYDSIQDEW